MPSESATAGRDPARNLQVFLGGAGVLFVAWSWGNFSGPFRSFVDLQLRCVGGYSEVAAGIASAVVAFALTGLLLVLLKRAYPALSSAAADAVVAILFVAASAAALWQVGHLWHEATRMPRLNDPVQVVDLDTIGHGALPVGHVRIIGTPDVGRAVFVHSTGRHAAGSYWQVWAALASRAPHGADAPPRIVATARGPDQVSAARAVHDDPEGLLLYDSVDMRTVYQLRQAGLAMDERSYVLHADEGVRSDKLVDAALLGSLVVLFWGFAAHGWLKEHRARRGSAVVPPADSPVVEGGPVATDADADAPASPESSRPADGWLTRVGVGGSVAAIGAGGFLWEVFGFFPSRVALLGYAAAAVTFTVSLLLLRLERRPEPTAPEGAPPAPWPPPPLTAPPHALAPPPGAALLCVLRDEPGFSSPSYKRVDVDGVRVADLQANRYIVVALRPGPHSLAVNTRVSLVSDAVARFDVAAGDVVAYRLQIPFFGPLRLERTSDIAGLRSALLRLKPAAPS